MSKFPMTSSYCGSCVYVHWTVPSSPIWEGHHRTGWTAMSVVLVHGTRGGWSHYYKHGAAPIMQYMHGCFNPVQPADSADHIYVRAKLYVLTSSGMCFG